jgi:hypothetical protein
MLRVTIDVFSGRPNPSYVLADTEARQLLQDVARRRGAVADVASGFDGLGFRGVVVESLADDGPAELGDLPAAFRLGGGAALDEGNGLDLADRLVRGLVDRDEQQVDASRDAVSYVVDLLSQPRSAGTPSSTDGADGAAVDPTTCQIERTTFKPAFWNDPSTMPHNNCYNYASNWRTNSFAQPGRGAGHQYTALTCGSVGDAALADGCHRRFDCFPDTEKNRHLVALVIAPGFDYHWYRIHSAAEGFWGHKPGQTAARNVDNSNHVVVNPETADRGPYTQFCGYFYTCHSQALRIH